MGVVPISDKALTFRIYRAFVLKENKMKEETKKCSKCSEEKALSLFSKQSGRKDGRASQCKACKKEYREENKIEINLQRKGYRENNKEKLKDSDKRYYEGNKNARREKSSDNYYKNRNEISSKRKSKRLLMTDEERISESDYHKEYLLLYPKEKLKETKRKWKERNKDSVVFCNNKRRACKKRSYPINLSQDDIFKIKRIYKESSEIKGITVDHIIPIQGKLPDGKRVLGAHRPSNLQLLGASENFSKANKITYKDLEKAIEGHDYIFVPNDYHDNPNNYPSIGFDIEGEIKEWKIQK